MTKGRLSLLCLLASAAALAACGQREESGPVVVTPPAMTAVAASPETSCATCHGAQGEGQGSAGFPRIAGQSAAYLQRQLDSFADGSRRNPVMEPIAKALTPEQRAAVAEHFAAMAPDVVAQSGGGVPVILEAAAGRGRLLAQVGDKAKGVQACVECHGEGGLAGSDLAPYLAGQHMGYLNAALQAWSDGKRNNDPTGKMPGIAKGLSASDIAALSAYYAAQEPRETPVDAERLAAAPQTNVLGAGGSTTR